MCRNIKPLFNFDPPATEAEIKDAARQFVRKLSGFTEPSAANRVAFEQAIDAIARDSARLLSGLTTAAAPHDRAVESAKAKARAAKRFGKPDA